MSLSDPIANMLTNIRNAMQARGWNDPVIHCLVGNRLGAGFQPGAGESARRALPQASIL